MSFVLSTIVILLMMAEGLGKEHLDTVKKFAALETSDKFEEAAELFADDLKFSSPRVNFDSKEAWLEGFPARKKAGFPEFGEPEVVGDQENQIKRKGKAKLGFISFSVVQVIEINDDGKIQKMTITKS
jgi:hypothetical protein